MRWVAHAPPIVDLRAPAQTGRAPLKWHTSCCPKVQERELDKNFCGAAVDLFSQ
jgi:hypothetical protein